MLQRYTANNFYKNSHWFSKQIILYEPFPKRLFFNTLHLNPTVKSNMVLNKMLKHCRWPLVQRRDG